MEGEERKMWEWKEKGREKQGERVSAKRGKGMLLDLLIVYKL